MLICLKMHQKMMTTCFEQDLKCRVDSVALGGTVTQQGECQTEDLEVASSSLACPTLNHSTLAKFFLCISRI